MRNASLAGSRNVRPVSLERQQEDDGGERVAGAIVAAEQAAHPFGLVLGAHDDVPEERRERDGRDTEPERGA